MSSYAQNGRLNIEELKEELEKIQGNVTITDNNGEFPVIITVDGYTFEIDDKGNIVLKDENQGEGEAPTPPVEENLAKDVLKIDSTATDEASKSPFVTYNGLNCRVLYNDETHGLQIITSESVEDVTLGYGDSMVTASDFTYSGPATIDDRFKIAAASYNNAVDNLNNKAKSYIDKKGIATDARCLGSIPTLNSNSKFQGDTTTEMYVNTDIDYLETHGWNNKFKNGDENYLEDVNQLNSLGLNVSSGNTWLASRVVMPDDRNTEFDVSALSSSVSTNPVVGNIVNVRFVNSMPSVYCRSESNGVRPVFLLSSNVTISSGDGSSENPYVIE